MTQLLLISSATIPGAGYLDHCEDEIRALLSRSRRILLIPYAQSDHETLTARARARLFALGYDLESLHRFEQPLEALQLAEAIFIPGGNTFRLLAALLDSAFLDPLRARIESGTPFIGISAGANLAGPTIQTSNDMPIVYPPAPEALALVPFNINPHYHEPDTPARETRASRIREFHEESCTPVLALREGALLRIDGRTARLAGSEGARLFRRGELPLELGVDERLDFLLD